MPTARPPLARRLLVPALAVTSLAVPVAVARSLDPGAREQPSASASPTPTGKAGAAATSAAVGTTVGRDPHSAPRAFGPATDQVARLLLTGDLVDVCQGSPCTIPPAP
ncbi:MAG: hypothetical protein Q8K58_01570 [Acidimicrobiales bacterium]|nr:hypothetical protein [Acidimicrobiales bacterium]